jgi:hypothetical protein
MMATNRTIAGSVIASRQKGPVLWQARVGVDRGRIVQPSESPTVIELLTEPELLELLGESTDLHDDEGAANRFSAGAAASGVTARKDCVGTKCA